MFNVKNIAKLKIAHNIFLTILVLGFYSAFVLFPLFVLPVWKEVYVSFSWHALFVALGVTCLCGGAFVLGLIFKLVYRVWWQGLMDIKYEKRKFEYLSLEIPDMDTLLCLNKYRIRFELMDECIFISEEVLWSDLDDCEDVDEGEDEEEDGRRVFYESISPHYSVKVKGRKDTIFEILAKVGLVLLPPVLFSYFSLSKGCFSIGWEFFTVVFVTLIPAFILIYNYRKPRRMEIVLIVEDYAESITISYSEREAKSVELFMKKLIFKIHDSNRKKGRF